MESPGGTFEILLRYIYEEGSSLNVLEDAAAFDAAYWNDPMAWHRRKPYRSWFPQDGETPRVSAVLDDEQWLHEAPDYSLEYMIDKCWLEIKRRHGGVHAQRSLVKSMNKLLDEIAFGE